MMSPVFIGLISFKVNLILLLYLIAGKAEVQDVHSLGMPA